MMPPPTRKVAMSRPTTRPSASTAQKAKRMSATFTRAAAAITATSPFTAPATFCLSSARNSASSRCTKVTAWLITSLIRPGRCGCRGASFMYWSLRLGDGRGRQAAPAAPLAAALASCAGAVALEAAFRGAAQDSADDQTGRQRACEHRHRVIAGKGLGLTRQILDALVAQLLRHRLEPVGSRIDIRLDVGLVAIGIAKPPQTL